MGFRIERVCVRGRVEKGGELSERENEECATNLTCMVADMLTLHSQDPPGPERHKNTTP